MKRALSLLLALGLALSLSACGREAEPESVLGAAANVSEDRTALTADGREVPAWQYLYWLARSCDAISAYCKESDRALDWSQSLSGETMDGYACRQAVQNAVLCATVESWAETYSCPLTEADRADLLARQEESPALAEMGLDTSRAAVLAGQSLLYHRLLDLAKTAGSPLAPDAEDLADFAQGQGLAGVRVLWVSAGTDAAAAQKRVQDAFAALNESADPAAAFPALAETYGDSDGPVAGTVTFLPGDGTLPQTLEDAACALEEGRWSGILEGDGGWAILLRCPPEDAAVTERWFDEALQSAAGEAEVSLAAWCRDLSAADFYERLAAQRERLSTQEEPS